MKYLQIRTSPLLEKIESPAFIKIIEASLRTYGGDLRLLDMCEAYERTGFEEDSIRNLNTSALCDGKTIYLHNQPSSQGGPINRSLDLVHLFGHAIAWHISPPEAQARGLKFYGESAQRLASKDFRGASVTEIRDVEDYEIEAHRFLLGILNANKQPLRASLDLNDNEYESVCDHFRTLCAMDTFYICQFYRNPNLPSLRDFYEARPFDDLTEVERIRNRIVAFELPPSETTPFKKLEALPLPVIIGASAPELPQPSKRSGVENLFRKDM